MTDFTPCVLSGSGALNLTITATNGIPTISLVSRYGDRAQWQPADLQTLEWLHEDIGRLLQFVQLGGGRQ